MDRTATLLLAAAMVFAPAALIAQHTPCDAQQARVLQECLRNDPTKEAHIGAARYTLVNDRFEPVKSRKEARKGTTYLLRITPAGQGWSVQVLNAYAQVLMDGTSLDREGQVLDGAFTYRDAAGRLRAEGRFDHGRKTGVWHRYDAQGQALPDKTYYGEDWDAQQVRVGLASMSNELRTDATAQAQ